MAWIVDGPLTERYLPGFRMEWESGEEFTRSDYFRMQAAMAARPEPDKNADDLMPKRLTQTSVHEQLPDFLFPSVGWIVSDGFRRLVETIEPSIHRFVPVEVRDRSGDPAKKSYHYCFVGNRIDAGQLVAGMHIWRSYPSCTLYFSDELKTAVEQAKLRKLRFQLVEDDATRYGAAPQ